MATRSTIAPNEAREIAQKRNKLVLDQAQSQRIAGDREESRLSGRVPSELVEAAKQRAHVNSDTELLELALSRLALEDDFGAKLVRRKGSVPQDLDFAI